MALQIWLPLNGNLNSQGLTDVTLSSGTPTYTAGKIGQCLSTGSLLFNVSNNLVTTLGSTNIYSMCCWCKDLNTSTGARWVFQLGSGSGTSRGLWESNATASRHWAYNGSGINMATSINTVDGNWHHICFTSSGSTVKLYVDGIYQSQSTSASTTAMANNTLALTCTDYNLNDFRVYDHTLSPREVAEIAKGLVLHYPLNREGFGGDNIIPNTSPSVIQYSYPSSGFNDKFAVTTTIIPTASQYTLSFWGKSTVNGDKVRAHYYSPNTTTTCVSSQGITKTANDGNMDFTLSTDWTFYWVTYTQTETTAIKHVIFPRMGAVGNTNGVSSGTGTVSIMCLKFEEGSAPTPWIPNPSDALYTKMGLDRNVVYDCSGYKHDGTLSVVSYDQETPRYSVAMKFPENASTVTVSPCFSSGQTINEMSVSVWFKTNTLNSTAPNMFSLGENSFFRARISNATGVWYYIRVGTTQCSSTYACKTVTDNLWHLFTITFNNGVVCVYIDGVQVGTTNHSSTATYLTCSNVGTTWHLAGYTANSENFIGSLSDFRVYATALTAQQVLELYQTPISLAYNGVLLSVELQE